MNRTAQLHPGAAALAAAALVAAGCSGKPAGEFPTEPSPRDGVVLISGWDTSCDSEVLPAKVVTSALGALITHAAWREGNFALATIRSNSILNLSFVHETFRSQKESSEAIRRDLQAQRNAIQVSELAAVVEEGRSGPCRTDLLLALQQIQRELSSIGAGSRPVLITLVTNGIVVARGENFLDPTSDPDAHAREIFARGDGARLPGVRIVFVGLGRAPGVGAKEARWLERFWAAYAREAGAEAIIIRSVEALVARLEGAS